MIRGPVGWFGLLFYRTTLVLLSYVISCLVGGAVLALSATLVRFTELAVQFELSEVFELARSVLFASGVMAGFALYYATVPSVILIFIFEFLGIRSALVFAMAGAYSAIMAFQLMVSQPLWTISLPLGFLAAFVAAGSVAGLTLWALVGRKAGIWLDEIKRTETSEPPDYW